MISNKQNEYMREYRKRDYVKYRERKSISDYRKKHPEKIQQINKRHLAKLRMKVFEKYGFKCVRCGYDRDLRALCIDHVHGHGNKEHREIGMNKFLNKVLTDNEGNYQILCANCNIIKKYENHEYYKKIRQYPLMIKPFYPLMIKS